MNTTRIMSRLDPLPHGQCMEYMDDGIWVTYPDEEFYPRSATKYWHDHPFAHPEEFEVVGPFPTLKEAQDAFAYFTN